MIEHEKPWKKINKWALFEKIGYKVYSDRVRDFHNDVDARVKVACAPRRTTKSYCAAHDVLPILLFPDTRVWVVGPSYTLAEKEFRYIHQALVINRKKLGLPKPRVCLTNARSGQLYIEWPWGAILEGKTADRPDSLLGEAVDAVIYSEGAQLKRGIRERYVKPTLVTKRGIEIIPTTPDQGGEWVHEEWELGLNPEFPEILSYHWGIEANPTYDIEEFNDAKKRYGEDSPVFREQYLGEWVFYAGAVYPFFHPDTHVIEPFKIPKEWPRIGGLDFGHRDPFVCLWAAVGPEQELYFYREYYNREGHPLPEHAKNVKNLTGNENIGLTVADPSSAQGIEDLNYYGLPCVPAENERYAGRMRVSEYMTPTDDGPVPFPLKGTDEEKVTKKRPRMYFFNTMKETIREIQYFRWKERTKREGEKESTEGEDHACDTMRYICMTRPTPFRPQKRVLNGTFKYHMKQRRNERMRRGRVNG